MSDKEGRAKELEHIKGALRVNGYPDWLLEEMSEEVDETLKETGDDDKRSCKNIKALGTGGQYSDRKSEGD